MKLPIPLSERLREFHKSQVVYHLRMAGEHRRHGHDGAVVRHEQAAVAHEAAMRASAVADEASLRVGGRPLMPWPRGEGGAPRRTPPHTHRHTQLHRNRGEGDAGARAGYGHRVSEATLARAAHGTRVLLARAASHQLTTAGVICGGTELWRTDGEQLQ